MKATIALTLMELALFARCLGSQEAQAPAVAQPNAASERSYQVNVPGTKQWVDTNINVRGGAKLRFTATGTMTYPRNESYAGKLRTSGSFGPAGLARGFADLVHQYAVTDAGHGALVGRIGSGDYAQAFLIGESKEYHVPVAGRLYLGINQSTSDASIAEGSFHVNIAILEEGSASVTNVGGPPETAIPSITPDLLNKIPRRVIDPDGRPGDMVNF